MYICFTFYVLKWFMKNKMFIVYVMFLISCAINPETTEQQINSCTTHKDTEIELIESCNYRYKRKEFTTRNSRRK